VRLADLDRDGALTEAVEGLCGTTRAGFLRSATLGAGALLGALSAPALAAEPSPALDLKILNFGLRFERLQASFYTEAEDIGTIASMSAVKQRWAKTLGAHERAHVRILKQVLGKRAEGRPAFDFGEANQTDAAFTRTAVAMEDLTTALLTGVTPLVHDRRLTAALMGLLTVEARHAAWARHIDGRDPAPDAFDHARTLHSVKGTIARTHFIAAPPRTTAHGSPRYSG